MSKPHKCKWRPFRGTVDFPTDGRVVCDEGCGRQLSAREVCVLLNAPKVKYRKVGTVEALALLDEVKMFGNRATPIFVHSPRKVRI